jgi:glutaminyl-tRNA synthetase
MTETNTTEVTEKRSLNFIEQVVEDDLKAGKNDNRIQTRFPPEPNGYLHIGHAKAICLDFGIAARYGGVCNLRFDDTNPTKEDMEYVDAIKEDIQWLGFQWGNEYYASDYFQQLWDFAVALIKEGKAYIDEQTSEEIAAQKGTPTVPGTESPYRNRPASESLDLFQKMNAGEIEEGKMVLRAKIDMASPNMHFRPHHLSRGEDPASPHRRQVEGLPDVRLCPRAERFLRGCHPLALHARVRASPSALRPVCGLGEGRHGPGGPSPASV